ncbi:VanZ family protein [Cupriavidus sp. YAF13]|uniref:VanZ family protein n=1 Tax=Cupriavidus sp. YAF13 TaxID=3233075 RepID=UPI003F8EF41F
MPIESQPLARPAASILGPRAGLLLSLAAAFYLLMLLVGNQPGNAQAMSQEYGDKNLHLVAYACIAGAIHLSFTRYRAATTLTGIALLGGLDEFIQSFFPYRSSDLADLLTDLLAAVAAIVLISLARRLSRASAWANKN